jgi:hypothetical protein
MVQWPARSCWSGAGEEPENSGQGAGEEAVSCRLRAPHLCLRDAIFGHILNTTVHLSRHHCASQYSFFPIANGP